MSLIRQFFFKSENSKLREPWFPKNPWDVMGCQAATCFEAPGGVMNGGFGVSIGGFRILRVG